MTSINVLRRQVAALRAKIGRPDDPKEWAFLLIDDEPIPDHIQAQIAPQDSVYIRRLMLGYMPEETGEWEPSIGTVTTAQGRVTCLYRSGKTKEVHNERSRSRRH